MTCVRGYKLHSKTVAWLSPNLLPARARAMASGLSPRDLSVLPQHIARPLFVPPNSTASKETTMPLTQICNGVIVSAIACGLQIHCLSDADTNTDSSCKSQNALCAERMHQSCSLLRYQSHTTFHPRAPGSLSNFHASSSSDDATPRSSVSMSESNVFLLQEDVQHRTQSQHSAAKLRMSAHVSPAREKRRHGGRDRQLAEAGHLGVAAQRHCCTVKRSGRVCSRTCTAPPSASCRC